MHQYTQMSDEEIKALVAEAKNCREAVEWLGGYVATCRKQNQSGWMFSLAKRLNEACERVGFPDRFKYDGRDYITRDPDAERAALASLSALSSSKTKGSEA